ncbi:hypothetical protein Goari_025208 [Gossypium aridum]|uniref:Reverse transcriptase zinc-binding domain-containing protein n=1 Tax=Gossypium aridum TaxID=34290 RepID=A0A7J8X8Z0_GOSAI|nr:hypothetical protein [Gossypium aridum]
MNKLLQEGMAWRVGRGDNISIWKNAWVLRLKNHKIQESVRNHNLDKVVDLIDPILRQWKERIITSTFVRGEAEAILNTPLARYPREDCRVWSGEPIGDYTVRRGYRRLIMEYPSLTIDDAKNTFKTVSNSALCFRCSGGSESLEHVFRDCLAIQGIWNTLGFQGFEEEENMNFQQCLGGMLTKLTY